MPLPVKYIVIYCNVLGYFFNWIKIKANGWGSPDCIGDNPAWFFHIKTLSERIGVGNVYYGWWCNVLCYIKTIQLEKKV